MKYLNYFLALSLPFALGTQADQALEGQPATVSAYLDALDEAEAEYGSYDGAIADIYFGLGNALQESREYDQAREAYLRGMQVQRVNNGLYDIGQIPYLHVLADLAKSRRGWSDAADYLEQAYLIQVNNYQPDDPLLAQSLRARIDLHLMAYAEMGVAGHKHLASAFKVDAGTVQKFLPDPSTQLDEFIAMVQRSVVINYEMAVLTYSGEAEKEDFFSTDRSLKDASVQDPTAYYLKGRAGLIAMVDAVQQYSNDPMQIASAYADLGDWYLLFNKKTSASKHYKIAYEVAANQQNGEELAAQMFSTPLLLPRYNLPRAFSDDEKSYRLTYSITVLSNGRARAAKLVEQPSDVPVRIMRKAKNYLKLAKFRPLMVNGVPQSRENHRVLINVQ